MQLIRKFTALVKEQGVCRALKGVIHVLAVELYAMSERRFDMKHHVDTSSIVRIEQYDIAEEKKETSVRYQPTPITPLRTVLKALDIDHSHYTFIDIGSGKGRVLLLASEYPYKTIAGVEISQQLHLIAEKNFATWSNPRQKCRNLRSFCTDACEYEFPEGPLVLFFFTPFTAPILTKVIDSLKRSLQENPRPVQIIYFGSNQELIDIFKGMNFTSRQVHERIPFLNYQGMLFSSDAMEVVGNHARKTEGI